MVSISREKMKSILKLSSPFCLNVDDISEDTERKCNDRWPYKRVWRRFVVQVHLVTKPIGKIKFKSFFTNLSNSLPVFDKRFLHKANNVTRQGLFRRVLLKVLLLSHLMLVMLSSNAAASSIKVNKLVALFFLKLILAGEWTTDIVYSW